MFDKILRWRPHFTSTQIDTLIVLQVGLVGVVLNTIVLYLFYNERQSLTTSVNTMTWYYQHPVHDHGSFSV